MSERASIHIKCNSEEKEQFLSLLYFLKAKDDKKLNNIDILLKSMKCYNESLNDKGLI